MSTTGRLAAGSPTTLDWSHPSLFPLLTPKVRVEERLEHGLYTVRADLPRIDPVNDVRITVAGGVLHLDVCRAAAAPHGRSACRYLTLPAGVREKTLTARYADGVLEITAEVGDPPPPVREIPVEVGRNRQTGA